MQRKKITLMNYNVLIAIFAVLACLPRPALAVDGVCGAGTGVPPFLSSGLDPNLLLVLDNSGSMLDSAYTDTTYSGPAKTNSPANDGACVDNDFDPAKTYAGYFDPEKWYEWREGVQQWQSGKPYTAGMLVYTEGVFYRAESSGTSNSAEILTDTNVTWKRIHKIPTWTNGQEYDPNTFVQFQNLLYFTAAGGTAADNVPSDGISLSGDTGITDWDLVESNSTWRSGVTYVAGDVVSDNGMLFQATKTTSSTVSAGVDDGSWVRLDEGHFVEAAYSTVSTAATALSGKAGTAYQQNDLYVKIVAVTNTSTGLSTNSGVTAFAASGDFLNWLSSSKLDIQKKILTGGKYNEEYNLLVSEGRGCSSRGFIKEVPVNSTKVMTFSVRGFQESDWIDPMDSTTRIGILGVSEDGFIGDARQLACQTAIEEISLGDQGSLGTIQTNINTCLSYDLTSNNVLAASNAAYNHSVFTCWSIVQKGYTEPSQIGNVSELENACGGVYATGISPATIYSSDSGYACSGIYNQTISHASRQGYIGRCWEPGQIPAGCQPVLCSSTDYEYNTGDPRCFPDKYVYECSGNYNEAQGTCNKAWTLRLEDIAGDELTCAPTATGSIGKWTDDPSPQDAEQCIQQGIWDYCQSLKIPEVIDPTDQIFNSGETWGMTGSLIDSGVAAKFGSSRPLIVMKGYVTPPVDKDNETVIPQGIIHENKDDLRMGAMAFNNNGAGTECQTANVNDTIVQYCPDGTLDGAKVIAPIKNSDATTEGVDHLDYLTKQINAIRADAWTPLGEAIYNGLGYYGQNAGWRINDADLTNKADFPISIEDDPVQAWCQANNILVITEGASTADINAKVKAKITALAGTVQDTTVPAAEEGECTVDAQHYLYGSTYLDDLTFFGQNAIKSKIYSVEQMESDNGEKMNKQNIRTYIVSTGNAGGDGTTGECNPAVLMENAAENGGTTLLPGENAQQLEESLRAALADIMTRASAGSAASVISSARSGEGAIYQAIFWPEMVSSFGQDEYRVNWVGDVHGLLIDDQGHVYEDSNHNRSLDLDSENGTIDKRVIVYFDQSENKSKGCYGQTTVVDGGVTCTDSVNLEDVNFLWSAHKSLADLTDVQSNRSLTGANFNFAGAEGRKRYIFTWNDADHDGAVGTGEVVGLTKAANPTAATWTTLAKNFIVDGVFTDNDDYTALEQYGYELNNIIGWLRGDDWLIDEDLDNDGLWDPGVDPDLDGVFEDAEVDTVAGDGPPREPLRSRKSAHNNTLFTWRLGDVINSTPITVTSPNTGYHLIYNDGSYAKFVAQYKKRRHVVYFGGNDGMLHAVNAGFYSDVQKKFCLEKTTDTGNCQDDDGTQTLEGVVTDTAPALGMELWAYVPYNLQPHLKCLSDPAYAHKYFVDLEPSVFDAQIFPADADHPEGWGTILVGGLRFGGAPIDGKYIDSGGAEKTQHYISSFFILDITNPEKPPVLLGETTQDVGQTFVDLGYSTVKPSIVAKKTSSTSLWYLVFGSGPHGPNALKGVSDQQAKMSVLPLNELAAKNISMRIPKGKPTAATSGTFFLPGGVEYTSAELSSTTAVKGFVSDTSSLDLDLTPSGNGVYDSDVVYFGTIEGSFDYTSLPKWNGGGQMFRLVMNGDGHTIGVDDYQTPGNWALRPLLDLGGTELNNLNRKQPISAAPTVGWDGDRYWVYFGTGRFFDKDDKTDVKQQSFYGIKEPISKSITTPVATKLTWDEVELDGVDSALPGGKGLLQVDEIMVKQSKDNLAPLACRDNTTGGVSVGDYTCLPSGMNSADSAFFGRLETYIAGTGNCDTASPGDNCVDGWYRDFYPYLNRERNLGQATLLSGLVTYTTYQPFSDACKAEGDSYLYAVYFRTGTSWYENIFGEYGLEEVVYVKSKLELGRGLTTTPNLFTGSGQEGVKVFVQTSTGEIKELLQENLPLGEPKSGRASWKEFMR